MRFKSALIFHQAVDNIFGERSSNRAQLCFLKLTGSRYCQFELILQQTGQFRIKVVQRLEHGLLMLGRDAVFEPVTVTIITTKMIPIFKTCIGYGQDQPPPPELAFFRLFLGADAACQAVKKKK